MSTVSYTIKRHLETGGNSDTKRSGRPKATSQSEDKFLKVNSLRDRRLIGQQLQAQLNTGRSGEVSVSTVKRRLRAAGLTGRVAVRKPLLRWQNKKKRFAWAMKHPASGLLKTGRRSYGPMNQNLKSSVHHTVFVRRRVGERMVPQCV